MTNPMSDRFFVRGKSSLVLGRSRSCHTATGDACVGVLVSFAVDPLEEDDGNEVRCTAGVWISFGRGTSHERQQCGRGHEAERASGNAGQVPSCNAGFCWSPFALDACLPSADAVLFSFAKSSVGFVKTYSGFALVVADGRAAVSIGVGGMRTHPDAAIARIIAKGVRDEVNKATSLPFACMVEVMHPSVDASCVLQGTNCMLTCIRAFIVFIARADMSQR